jgi:hypothetical protein
MVSLILLTATLSAAEAPKSDAKLAGTWRITTTDTDRDGANFSRRPVTFSVNEKEASWDRDIPFLFEEKGKAKAKIDASKTPPTIELTLGGKVYRGIYHIRPSKDGKEEFLVILISKPGGEAPKMSFDEERPATFPKGFKGTQLTGSRKQ